MTERGRVVAVDGPGLWVETLSSSACMGCRARQGCGHGLLQQWGARRRNHLYAWVGEQAADFDIGDEVDLILPEGVLIASAMVVYLLPLLGMLTGMALAARGGDLAALLGAGLGLGLGFAGVRLHGQRRRHDPRFQVKVLRRGEPAADPVLPQSGSDRQIQA